MIELDDMPYAEKVKEELSIDEQSLLERQKNLETNLERAKRAADGKR